MNIPGGPNAATGVGRLLLLGGAAVVGAINSLFNVEGGHRAIVFNRLTGIKDTVRLGPLNMHVVEREGVFVTAFHRRFCWGCA